MANAATASATGTRAAGSEAKPAGSGKKTLIVLLVIALILLGGGGAAAWYFLGRQPDKGTEHAVKPAPPPKFLALDAFTVNLADDGADHFLQVGIVFQVADDKAVDALKLYMPVLRNRILLLLAAKRSTDISHDDGKRRLVAEILAGARGSVPGTTPEKGIVDAMFASFVIQ